MGHCGRAKEHVDSHTSGRWEPVKINFRLKMFCSFSVKKEKKKNPLGTICYFIHAIVAQTTADFKKLVPYIKTNYIDLLHVIFKSVNKLEIPENSSL